MGSLRSVETAPYSCILFQCHTEQFFCDLLAFQTHDIVLHVIPGEQIHAAIPDDLFINHSKMLAVILNQAYFTSSRSQTFQQTETVFILPIAVNIRVPGNDRNLQAIFLAGLQKRNQLLYPLPTQGGAGDHYAFRCFPNVLFKDRNGSQL